MIDELPADKPLFSYYGDDFTGSTDALEALALNGLETVLFLRTPDEQELARFSHCQAVGIAGTSRSRSPEWMDQHLPAVFQRLRSIGGAVVQYKVCSTFDSSPEAGNIGRALEIGLEVFGGEWAPVVPAAPRLRRYVVFGNMFAADNGSIHRIDRHPTMEHHPVTPMDESDLRIHLARQTRLPIGLVDLLSLRNNASRPPEGARVVMFDGLEPADMSQMAEILWKARAGSQLFAVGSSGFTYGMLEYWRGRGWIPKPRPCGRPPATDRLLVLSGSCSPATGRQIRAALQAGFHGIRLDASRAAWPQAEREAVARLSEGRSVVVYTALGPDELSEVADRQQLGAAMGRLLNAVARASGVTRVVVAGGDTSSHAVRELNLTALTYAAPLVSGAPLCRAHGWHANLELVLKGGQMGSDDFFQKAMSWA
jgi:uncharacterized protein YgbK (DUF1537 family)